MGRITILLSTSYYSYLLLLQKHEEKQALRKSRNSYFRSFPFFQGQRPCNERLKTSTGYLPNFSTVSTKRKVANMTIITVPEQNVDVALPKAFDGVPSPLHPANVDYEAAGGNAAMKQVSDVLAWGWDEANAINDLRPNMDPEHRSATHDRLIRERVDASQRVWADKMDSARASLVAEQRRVDRQLEDAAGLKSNPAHFDAITSAFFSMKPGQRAETLAQLVEQGENAALATLMEAPLFLTGLLAEQRDSIKTRVLEKVNPAGLKLSQQLAKAYAKLEAASIASLPMFATLKSGTEPGAAATRARMAAARNMAANAGQR